jgi:hypothetical protein
MGIELISRTDPCMVELISPARQEITQIIRSRNIYIGRRIRVPARCMHAPVRRRRSLFAGDRVSRRRRGLPTAACGALTADQGGLSCPRRPAKPGFEDQINDGSDLTGHAIHTYDHRNIDIGQGIHGPARCREEVFAAGDQENFSAEALTADG